MGEGYEVADLVYYLAMMLALGGTYMALGRFGVDSHILRLLVALIVGVGAGWLAERVYRARNSREPRPGE